MNQRRRLLILLWTFLAFGGGAVSAHVGHATTKAASPYSPLSQLAEVLVFVENKYVDPVKRQQLLRGAIKGMVSELDPHSSYLTPEEFRAFNEDTQGTFGGIGVEVDFKHDFVVVITPLEGTPAARAGIKAGDKIIGVDGKALRGLSIDKIVRLMRGPARTTVKVSIRREGTPDTIHLDIVREHIRVRSVEGKRLVDNIAYLRIKQFQQGTHDELLDVLGSLRDDSAKPLRGVVLDMRGNPGGLVDEAQAVADEFLSEGGIYSTRHRGKIDEDVRAHRGGALSALPIVTLVNEYSASAAELVAGALQDNDRSLIIGARTFGKGSVQTIYTLSGDSGLRLTTMRYYTPRGHAIQARGIYPDIAIRYTEDSAPAAVSEGKLEGHLPAERGPPGPKPTRVVAGGARPKYAPLRKVPSDPRQSTDVALGEAFREALKRARP